jgi:hypothetical protein
MVTSGPVPPSQLQLIPAKLPTMPSTPSGQTQVAIVNHEIEVGFDETFL